MYKIKCDMCKKTIGTTPLMSQSAKGGLCTDCKNCKIGALHSLGDSNLQYQILQKLLTQSAWAKYKKIVGPALAEYEKITQKTFWDLFVIPENRVKIWR